MAVKQYTALTSGTISIPVDYATSYPDFVYVENIIVGTVTLVGPLAISPSGTPTTGQKVLITWNASVTTTGVPITIFGETVPDQLSTKNFIAECIYTGVAWVVNILPDFAGVGIIGEDRLAASSVTTAKIADNSVELAKMYELATGSVIFGNASNRPTALSVADSTIVVGDSSTGLVSVAVSGDATLAKTGALTIANSAVTTAKIDDGAVTAAKLDSNVKRFSFTVQIDFSSASRLGGTINIPICYNCVIDDLHGTVMDPVLSTCSSIFKDDSGTVMTGSQIDITTGHLLGNVVNSTPTANNVFSSGDVLKIEPSAAGTLAGEVLYTICGYLT